MTRQYLREISLVLEGGGDSLDLSSFRVAFQVVHGETITSPQSARITIYNLRSETERQIQKEFSKVSLSGGYQGNSGLIFKGEIIQAVRGRENPVDTFITLVAKDSDTAHNYGVVNKALAAGHTYKDQVMECFKAMQPHGVELGFIADLGPKRMSRGVVLHGMAKDLLRTIGFETRTTASVQNGKLQMVKNDGFTPGEAIVLNSRTGMIGRPEQTIDGIVARCLLNPRIYPGVKLKIDEASISQQLFSPDYTAEKNNSMIPETAADGIYKVLFVDHAGDSRGGPWYTISTCLSASGSNIPLGLAQRGIDVDPQTQRYTGR